MSCANYCVMFQVQVSRCKGARRQVVHVQVKNARRIVQNVGCIVPCALCMRGYVDCSFFSLAFSAFFCNFCFPCPCAFLPVSLSAILLLRCLSAVLPYLPVPLLWLSAFLSLPLCIFAVLLSSALLLFSSADVRLSALPPSALLLFYPFCPLCLFRPCCPF